MIKNEFLGLKYNGIKNLYELNASNGVMRKIGWNCRKYIRWAEVHESENDREILISAGNSLVDDNIVPVALMGSVNQVLLNVQKWRLDKEYFSVEPNHRSDYQKLSVLISQEKLDEKYAASYLFDKNIDTPNLSERIQEIFYVTIIIDFFEGVT